MADKDKIENWAGKKTSKVYTKVEPMYETIRKAYENRKEADNDIGEYWDIYNAQADDNQFYSGNSECYVPVIRDAINARAKRALRQLFPNKFRHVEAVGSDGQEPKPQEALLEHYIRTTKLKSIVRSVLVSGDVTGQWNLYIDWRSTTRNVTNLVTKPKPLETVEGQTVELDADEMETVTKNDEITVEGPDIVDFATEDLVVIPPTCDDINKADITCLKLRLSKDQVKDLMDKGLFVIDDESDLSAWIDDRKGKQDRNADKERASDAGIKTEGTNKYALIYWAQAYIKFDKDEHKSLADIYFAGENDIIGIVKAPQWGQKRSIISAPVERVKGSFNGISKIEPVKSLQWNLNDFWNMGQDSAMYSLLPIVMTDPEKNPNYAMMVYGLAAVWPVDPNSTKMTTFPALWKDSMEMCGAITQRINQSLDVNEMMMGAMPKGRKNNAAMGAQQQEQSVAVIDHAERFEEAILDPLMELIFEYDAQFRDADLTVLNMGEIGVKAQMQTIPSQQWGERYFFQWVGTQFVMNTSRIQQQIALMNVLRGIPPQQLNGRKLDITPILENMVENTFGVEMGSRILIDERNMYTVPPEIEDEMLLNGIMVEPHEGDNDMEHMRAHQIAGQKSGDPSGLIRTHIQSHAKQMEKKRQMANPQPQQGAPGQGMPGGAGPGVPGTPRMGAQPAPQRPVQAPPGQLPMPHAG